jgi:cytochrome c oxidase assembly protein subunit 15
MNYQTGRSKLISLWLAAVCVAIIFMIFIGGLTRLTDSGLSITEWNPISGILPPLDESSWDAEFGKYKHSPEYIKYNSGMSLEEFKSIYLLEFFHRIAGRLTSLLYLVPLLLLFGMGFIKIKESFPYLIALVLLGGQGVMGWYMVKSGLVLDPHVSHFRLAAHLMLAVFLYVIIFWQLMKNSFDIMLLPSGTSVCTPKFWCLFSIILLLIQVMLGAFVAGLDGGLVYNSFPLMGDSFVPHEVLESSISFASFSEPVFVQFVHRIVAYILFTVITIFCFSSLKLKSNKFSKSVFYVFVSLFLQMLAGIVTILYIVPIPIALIHQFGAMVLLSCLLWSYFLLRSSDEK